MSLYTKALKHIDMNRVKELREEKIKQKKIAEEIREQIREELRNFNSPEFSNWRYDIDEGMTTSGMFNTTLPATGDTDLAGTSLDASSFSSFADASFNSGTDSGLTGGFSADDGIINFSGDVENSTAVLTNAVDLSQVDTVNISAIAGSNSNGGMVPNDNLYVTFVSPTDISDDFTVISKTSSSFSNVNITIPQEFRTSGIQIFLYSPTGSSGDQGRALKPHTIGINGLNSGTMQSLNELGGVSGSTVITTIVASYLRNAATQANYKSLGIFLWQNIQKDLHGPEVSENPQFPGTPGAPQYIYNSSYTAAPVSGRTALGPTGGDNTVTDADYIYIGQYMYDTFKGSKLYGVSNISMRRKTPMNVFVSLDSPEATAFIRTDPVMKGISTEDKKKKLLDMLDASDEYLLKYLGITGSSARPSDITMPNSWEVAGTRNSSGRSNIPASETPQGPATPIKNYGTDSDPKFMPSGPVVDPWSPKLVKNNKKKPVFAHYEPEGEVLSEKKRLKSPKDITSKIPGYYDDKPAPIGFPMSPPPKTINGYHPDLVDDKKIAKRFNRLDPQSAKAMPATGNPHIDKKVRAAAKKPK